MKEKLEKYFFLLKRLIIWFRKLWQNQFRGKKAIHRKLVFSSKIEMPQLSKFQLKLITSRMALLYTPRLYHLV